jgi:hypothetical protein
MQHLYNLHKDDKQLAPKVRAELNVDLLFILYFNSWASRCGPWKGLRFDDGNEQLDKHPDYLILKKVKTRKTYGVTVVWLAPGTHTALKIYAKMPRGEGDTMFLVPSQHGAHELSFSSALRTGGRRYVGGEYEDPQVTLIRKLFHLHALDETSRDKVLEAITDADKHSKQMSLSIYNAESIRKQAAHSKGVFEGVMGKAVEWPTEDLKLEDDLEILMDEEQPLPLGDQGENLEWESGPEMSDCFEDEQSRIVDVEGLLAEDKRDVPVAEAEQSRPPAEEKIIVEGEKTDPLAQPVSDEKIEAVGKRRKRSTEKAASSGHTKASNPLLPEHKDWIAEKRKKANLSADGLPAAFIHQWHEEGKRNGDLPADCSYDQVRSAARRHKLAGT